MVQSTLQAALLGALRKGATQIVVERSPYSNKHVFAKANLPGDSWDAMAYDTVHAAFLDALPANVELHVVYMHADVATLQTRVGRRGRQAEEDRIPDAYMQKLEELHELFLTECSQITSALTIDTANLSPFHVGDTVLERVNHLLPLTPAPPTLKRARE
jgi:deoxyadenosine/deoxycytidine kinase